jgi:ubiquinone/menaquinone biosynthesis C-methylase UbiE
VNHNRVDAIYAQRFPEADQQRARWREGLWQVLVRDFFSRFIEKNATVLDYGCGQGEFINAVEASRRIGIDARESSRETLDVEVEFSVPTGIRIPQIKSESVDVVFCSNLLEHLPDRETVTELLIELRRVLRPEGRLLVLGPNLRYTGSAYWDFFDHVLPFTHVTIAEALATGDLEVEKMIPRFLPYTTVGNRMTSLTLVKWYLRLPLAWRFFGAQFFVVAKKSGASALC